MKNRLLRWIVCGLLLTAGAACSLPPVNPVTREELLRTGIYRRFVIEESPEQVLNALNADGEVVLKARRNVPNKEFPVHLKILATADGIEVLDYDR